jgi:hypothetical protein
VSPPPSASCSMSTEVLSRGVKRPGRDVNHVPLSVSLLLTYAFMAGTGTILTFCLTLTRTKLSVPPVCLSNNIKGTSELPSGLWRGSAAACLLGLRVRIPPGECMSVSCDCFVCVLSGRGLCDGPIIRPEKSYRLWCVTECDPETSRMRRPWSVLGCCVRKINLKAN